MSRRWTRIFTTASPAATAAWLLAAVLLCLSLQILNGAPFLYFDTGMYVEQGMRLLDAVGLGQGGGPAPGGPGGAAGAASAAGGVAAAPADGTAQGSRSAVYSLFLALFALAGRVEWATPVQAIAFVLTVHLAARAVVRRARLRLSAGAATGLATLAACLGSAPFYAIFLMPDIFAPILILAMATLLALSGAMRGWERAACVALGAAAVVMHPSHLAIALGLTLAGGLVALVLRPRRAGLGVLLCAAVAAAGLAERAAFSLAVETATGAEVVYTPYLTARLITDGPGLEHLRETCPDPELATCDLLPMLERSERITAFNILFELDPSLGSFALADQDLQKRIMREQTRFALRVVADRPFSVLGTMLANTLDQAGAYSIRQTIATHELIAQIRSLTWDVPARFDEARLIDSRGWIGTVSGLHAAVYLVSLVALAALVAAPGGRLPPELRALGLMIALGILGNAFVCGAVSQPAARYGARVICLLPLAAALLALARFAQTSGAPARPAAAPDRAPPRARA